MAHPRSKVPDHTPADLLSPLEPRTLLAANLFAFGDFTDPDGFADPGAATQIAVNISNNGDAPARPAVLSARLSRDRIWGNADDRVIGIVINRTGLGVGLTAFRAATITVPPGTPFGYYFLALRADAAGRVTESDEADNTAFSVGRLFVLGAPGRAVAIGNSRVIPDADRTPSTTDFTAFPNAQTFTPGVERSFRIRNDGAGPLVLPLNSGVTISGNGATQFAVSRQPATVIQPGRSALFTIDFRPNLLGRHRATITFTTSDPANPVYFFTIAGTAVPAPIIEVRVGTETIPTQGSSRFIGPAEIGEDIQTTFTVFNVGGSVLTFHPPTITGPGAPAYVIIAQPTSLVLNPGQSASFTIQLLTTTPGNFNALLSFANSDPNRTPFSLSLLGEVRQR